MVQVFSSDNFKKLYKPPKNSSGEDNGQVTIIGGSSLFHGAPLLALKVASRIVDMVFFATPEKSVGLVAEKFKSKLLSFIWIPWDEVESYIEKSDAALIGPGFMRFRSEKVPAGERHLACDEECERTKEITKRFLQKFPEKKWVIDAGSLQVMDPDWIPENAILTPNHKELSILFRDDLKGIDDIYNLKNGEKEEILKKICQRHKCVIVLKGPETLVCSASQNAIVDGGDAGLTKGGTGDVLAGFTAALLAKNDPFLSACAASFVIKRAAEKLSESVGTNYNAEDVADKIPETLASSI